MKQYKFLCLLIVFISGYYALESINISSNDWNGDPKICTVDSITDDTPLPPFPNQAEFVIEKVKIKYTSDVASSSELTNTHYLYNYDTNKLILIKNINGTFDVEYYTYETLKKSTYYRQNICTVSDIDKEIEMDGTSAVRLQDNKWHIRPLNEFLLFSNNDTRETKIQPKFIGPSIIRGIPVNQWESCTINKTELRTYRIIWSLAQKGISVPTGIVGDSAVPIHALINSSVVDSNNIQIEKYDEVYNVHLYRPEIIETDDQLAPPRGVFCNNGSDQYLQTLQEFGIQWPDYFSVRVEASTSHNAQWQKFHLRYYRDPSLDIRRLRYDYLPLGSEYILSVIHDYGDNLTYVIDRGIGTCIIGRGVEYHDVNPIRDPIGFFIKHENQFIFNSRDKVWDFNGNRLCRADSIRCISVISSIDNYPVIIESGETWTKTDIEYGWSIRAPNATLPFGTDKYFDYPVYLFLRLYQYNDENIYTEDIEYEFYEISHEGSPFDFDTSLCYRSLNFEYLHVSFTLKLSKENIIDGNHLDRRLLERTIHMNLINRMQIRYPRVTDIEVDHEDVNSDVTVFFTLLGRTPRPEPTNISDDEPTANQSYVILKKAIDDETFEFTMQSTDDPPLNIQFQAVSGSLKAAKQYTSLHTIGKQVIKETYSAVAQTTSIIGGLLAGLLSGILLAAAIRILRKKPMPHLPNSFSSPLPNIVFYNKVPTNNKTASSDA